MKRLLKILTGTALFCLFTASIVLAETVESYKVFVQGVYVNVVSADLSSDEVIIKPAVAYKGYKGKYPSENFDSFIERVGPVAAINGTYHDTTTLKPVGTLIIDRVLENYGTHGTAICFAKNGEIHFYLTAGVSRHFIPWIAYEQVITSGPTLVFGGQIWLNPKLEKFKDPKVYANAKRSAAGKTKDGRFLFVTIHTPVSLFRLASIMQQLGCTDAVNLDGGGSSALYCKGKYITYTDRKLTNFLVITIQDKKIGAKF